MFEVSHSNSLPPLHLSNLFLYSVPIHVCMYLHVYIYMYIPQNGMDYVNVHVNVHCIMVGCIGYIIIIMCMQVHAVYNNIIT